MQSPETAAKIGLNGAGTRQKILDCAAQMFCDVGYGQSTIRALCAEVGISGPSFYHHFAAKEQMTVSLVRSGASLAYNEIRRVDPADFADSPKALIEAAIDAHLRAYLDPSRRLMALVRVYRQLPPNLFIEAREALNPYLAHWVDILRAAGNRRIRSNDEAVAASLFLFGAMNAMVDWKERPGFGLPEAALRELLADMVFDGIGSTGTAEG
jgi:AcrR family transcriptional regulator